MARPYYDQLLRRAKRLSRSTRAGQADLRGAVSAAYYSIFHCLIHHACQVVFGNRNDRRAYRDVLARAFDHGAMQDACKSFGGGTLPAHATPVSIGFTVSQDLRVVAQMFCNAQEKRHQADYDLSRTFIRTDVLAFIQVIENAIGRLRPIQGAPDTKFFLICLLTWKMLKSRK